MFIPAKDPFCTYSLFTALDEAVPGVVNNTNGAMNCYYCTVAHLSRMSVTDLVGDTELMQKSGGDINDIQQLLTAAGLCHSFSGMMDSRLLDQGLSQVPYSAEFGFCFCRDDQTGHMIVGHRDEKGAYEFYDARESQRIPQEQIREYIEKNKIQSFGIWLIHR